MAWCQSLWLQQQTTFHGKKGTRSEGKYQYLRKQVKEKGKGEGIDEVFEERESNKVNDLIHKVTKWVARYAKENRLAVAVGGIKEVNGDTGKGRKFNRRVNTMPTHRFKKYLGYKCRGVVFHFCLLMRPYTTQTCSRCGEKG